MIISWLDNRQKYHIDHKPVPNSSFPGEGVGGGQFQYNVKKILLLTRGVTEHITHLSHIGQHLKIFNLYFMNSVSTTYPIFTNLILHYVRKLLYIYEFFWLNGSKDFLPRPELKYCLFPLSDSSV
jgi:hypothetical protein